MMFLNRSVANFILLGLVIALCSCQARVFRGLMVEDCEGMELSVGLLDFDEKQEAHYRAKIEAFDQTISGQLIIKNLDSNYRAVIITDFGLTIMDLTLETDGDFKFNHIMKHMDYQFVRQSMALNVLMLLPQDFSAKNNCYSDSDLLLVHAPLIHSIYYIKKGNLEKVERYRGKNKLWCSAEKVGEDGIQLVQKNPHIAIRLKTIE